MEERKTGLAPLCPGCARVLVLGSMPSEKSIAAGFYYANPRNAFWPILAALYGEADEGTPEGRVARLGAHGVALWDSAASCFRRGSLDSAIRAAEINDIPAFLAAHAGIRAVLCNGQASHKLLTRAHPALTVPVRVLPSTSPAAASRSFAEKLAAWAAAFDEFSLREIP